MCMKGFEEMKMKKYLALVLAAVTVLLTLAACGANVDDETTAGIATEKASEYVQPSYEEVSGVEMIEGEKINVTLLKFTSALGYRLCFNPEKFATSLTSEAEYFRWVIEYDGLTPFFEVERTQGKVEDVCAALAQKRILTLRLKKPKSAEKTNTVLLLFQRLK